MRRIEAFFAEADGTANETRRLVSCAEHHSRKQIFRDTVAFKRKETGPYSRKLGYEGSGGSKDVRPMSALGSPKPKC